MVVLLSSIDLTHGGGGNLLDVVLKLSSVRKLKKTQDKKSKRISIIYI